MSSAAEFVGPGHDVVSITNRGRSFPLARLFQEAPGPADQPILAQTWLYVRHLKDLLGSSRQNMASAITRTRATGGFETRVATLDEVAILQRAGFMSKMTLEAVLLTVPHAYAIFARYGVTQNLLKALKVQASSPFDSSTWPVGDGDGKGGSEGTPGRAPSSAKRKRAPRFRSGSSPWAGGATGYLSPPSPDDFSYQTDPEPETPGCPDVNGVGGATPETGGAERLPDRDAAPTASLGCGKEDHPRLWVLEHLLADESVGDSIVVAFLKSAPSLTVREMRGPPHSTSDPPLNPLWAFSGPVAPVGLRRISP